MADNNQFETLSDRFESFGSAPSEKVWEGIEAGLSNNKRRPIALMWWMANAAILVLMVSATVYREHIEFKDPKIQQPMIGIDRNEKVNENDAEIQKEDEIEDKKEIELIHMSPKPLLSEENYKAPSIEAPIQSLLESSKMIRENRDDLAQLPLLPLNKLPDPRVDRTTHALACGMPRIKQRKWVLTARFSHLIGMNRSEYQQEAQPLQENYDAGFGVTYTTEDQYVHAISNYRHRQPIEVEVSAARTIGRWEVSAGVSSALMRRSYLDQYQHVSTGENLATSTINMRKFILGIPVRGEYKFWKHRRMSASVGLGVISEYSLSRMQKETLTSASWAVTPTPPTADFTGYEATANENSFQLSVQPYLKTSYALSPSMDLTGEIGYRQMLTDSREMDYVSLPKGTSVTFGLRWYL